MGILIILPHFCINHLTEKYHFICTYLSTQVNALLFWWGGYLIVNYPNIFKFHDFLIAMFSLLFALFALGASSIGSVEKKEAELATGRVFYLMERKSEIDPLENENEKMEV